MKERPILFSAPMVRAILLGSKTQTRRLLYVPSASKNSCFDIRYPPPVELPGFPKVWALSHWRHVKPGDRLWVRESTEEDCIGSASFARYTADGYTSQLAWWYSRKACPSIHMPRWASRILLEITAVRVERLNEISEADAIAEGVFRKTGETPIGDTVETWDGRGEMIYVHPMAARTEYRMLWESINGENSWSMNPFVWVIEFRRLEARNAST